MKRIIFGDNCPICNKKMNGGASRGRGYWWNSCPNSCYNCESTYATNISIFDEHYIFRLDPLSVVNNQNEEKITQVESKIRYWKENDRYLAQILAKE